MKPLPPINTLRIFEAAVRHQSFTKAADELGLTQSAVSHRIKDLEQYVGSELFHRKSRKSIPTKNGNSLAEAIRTGFNTIGDAVANIKTTRDDNCLMVSLLPGFAVKWLFPRLINFDDLHPDITVSLIAQSSLADLLGGEADIAIRYGRGNYPGLNVIKLHDEKMFPVCSPDYLRSSPTLKQPSDLAGHTLLFDNISTIDGITPGWSTWLSQTSTPDLQPLEKRQYGQSNMVIQAALADRGVALGRGLLVADDLASGQLIKPFEQEMLSGFSYYLVHPKTHSDKSKIRDFSQWIIEEIQQSEKSLII